MNVARYLDQIHIEANKHINMKVMSDQSILAKRQSWQLHHPYGEPPKLKVDAWDAHATENLNKKGFTYWQFTPRECQLRMYNQKWMSDKEIFLL